MTFKLQRLNRAVADWRKSLDIDISGLSPVVADAVMCGQIQKFEFVMEVFWKTVKSFLYEIHGFDEKSPKMAIKRFFQLGYVDASGYEMLMDGLNDRNRLSHLYSIEDFLEVHGQLSAYCAVISNSTKHLSENG